MKKFLTITLKVLRILIGLHDAAHSQGASVSEERTNTKGV